MLNVYTAGNLSGVLYRSEQNQQDYHFVYAKDCLPENAVSLTMNIIREPYIFSGHLHPIFDMNLPEGALLDKLKRTFQKQIHNFSDLDLLKIVGHNQIGRLTFGDKLRQNNEKTGLDIKQFKTYRGTEDLLQELINKYAASSGISGVQPKVLIKDTSQPDTQRVPKLSLNDKLTHKEATHIIKSWGESSDYPELASNEYFCMLAAKYAGLNVPKIELTNEGKFLIIERFDYNKDTDQYLGFEDFCALSAKVSAQKYDGTYERIARLINDNLVGISRNNLKLALTKYFKLVILSVALRNGDAHLKNFGLLYETPESMINLAPAYDIVTTTLYFNDNMALTMDGRKSWPSLKIIKRFGKNSCLLSEKEISQGINEVMHGISLAKELLIRYSQATPTFEKLGLKMAQIWDDGINHSLME